MLCFQLDWQKKNWNWQSNPKKGKEEPGIQTFSFHLVNLPYRLCRKQKNLQKRRIIEIKVLFTGKR